MLRCILKTIAVTLLHCLLCSFSVPGATAMSNKTHCLSFGGTLVIENPYSEYIRSPDLVIISLYSNKSQTSLFDITEGSNTTSMPSKYALTSSGHFLIKNVDLTDSAIYETRLFATSLPENTRKTPFNVVVAKAPTLKSEKLSVTTQKNDIDSVTFSCGEFSDLGSPAVSVNWKISDGSKPTSVYTNGFFKFQSKEEIQATCSLNMESLAAQCIASADLPKWQGTATGKAVEASIDLTIVVAAAVAGAVVIAIIILVVTCICMKRKKKGESYNAKKEAAKLNPADEADSSMVEDNDYEVPIQKAKSPIYKGPENNSLYMVSQITETKNNNRKDRMPPASHKHESRYTNENPPPTVPKKRIKEHEDECIDIHANDRKVPKAKPRSIFLTPSMEELDKIEQAVKGGKGSEAHGTLV
ncbi:uncharacterized protein LOC131939793 isoform X2 [Physella acuta]|nr:uncharacterized protein LOC131939793 isoform X2 [Physella acuta]XP_059154277.1 uncharacterized protein LOC131939793 isoform X2 [Physella acuta]XP_059154278.1 uncharacterized protein LOC131939793 isoform X2 [Physella acuta]